MLPILRIIPVGGVFLAIMILILSLGAPGGSRSGLSPAMWAARGPLMNIDEHPEWRQLLVRAALQRANELARLGELPGTPPQEPAHGETKTAVLPVERSDADPEDMTGTIIETPAATIPIDIGETSSTELPTIMPEERPPVVKTPGRVKSQISIQRKSAYRIKRAKPVKPEPPPQLSFFEVLFGVTPAKQPRAPPAPANQKTAGRVEPLQQR